MGRYNSGKGKATGAVYTRWGRTSCSSVDGTEMLYTGIVGGSHYSHYGAGANYLCLPNNPQYFQTGDVGQYSLLYGAEYEANIAGGLNNYNVPCSVCFASNRGAKIMIPAAIACPESWTEEYKGYLMAENHGHKRNVVYECVDQDAEGIPGTQGNTNGALFYHVSSSCGAGQKCPPFITKKPFACVVCTK